MPVQPRTRAPRLVGGAVPLEGRERGKGRLEVAVALARATGGLSSGLVVSSTSYAAAAADSGLLALAVTLRPGRTTNAPAAPR